MDTFSARVKRFFWPPLDVPEEAEEYKNAVSLRQAKVDELRAQLQGDPSLDEKIDGITARLLSGVESKV